MTSHRRKHSKLILLHADGMELATLDFGELDLHSELRNGLMRALVACYGHTSVAMQRSVFTGIRVFAGFLAGMGWNKSLPLSAQVLPRFREYERCSTTVLNALRDRLQLDTAYVDDVVMGVVSPVGEQGSNIARVAAIDAGYAETVAGVQINRFCASGLEAVNMAAGQVMSGQSDLVVGGGVESMSRIPMSSAGGAWYADPQVAFHSHYVPQGISADLIASLYGYSRADVDAFAAQSQARAAAAWEEKRFARSVAPVYAVDGQMLLDNDEHRRPGTTAESLAKLPASFEKLGAEYGFDAVALQRYPELERIEHVHHAGNSSGIVDGAAAVLVGNRETGERLGLKPRARIRAFASIGSEPTIMLTGPAPATHKVLKRAGMTPGDIDLYEVNEAFAAVVLRFADAVGVPMDRINVNGGAIALGHPLGMSGARLVQTAVHELHRRGARYALAVDLICTGQRTGELREEVTFVDVELWGKQAETAKQYLSKGRPVAVDGRLRHHRLRDEARGERERGDGERADGAADRGDRHAVEQAAELRALAPAGGGDRRDGGMGGGGGTGGEYTSGAKALTPSEPARTISHSRARTSRVVMVGT